MSGDGGVWAMCKHPHVWALTFPKNYQSRYAHHERNNPLTIEYFPIETRGIKEEYQAWGMVELWELHWWLWVLATPSPAYTWGHGGKEAARISPEISCSHWIHASLPLMVGHHASPSRPRWFSPPPSLNITPGASLEQGSHWPEGGPARFSHQPGTAPPLLDPASSLTAASGQGLGRRIQRRRAPWWPS